MTSELNEPVMPAGAEPEEEDLAGPGARAPQRSGGPRRVDLTRGGLLRGIVLLSWPIVAGAFLNWVMGAADIKMVGYLGPAAIAAVGTARGAIMTLMAIIFAISTGTQVLVARYTGERDADAVAGVTRQALILSVLAGVAMMPLGWWLAEHMLVVLGAEGEVLGLGTLYTQVYFIGAIGLMINFMLTAALNGAGDTLTPLYLLLGINTGHVLLEWLLIFGVGPVPALGVAGAAWAVVASRGVGAIILLWIISSGRFAIHMPLHNHWRIDLSVWWKTFYIGIPSSIQGFTRNLAYLMLLWILNQTDAGRLAVAGYTVCGQIQMVGLMVGLALMSAAMTAVGQNLGAGSPERAERSGWTVMRISAMAVAVMAAGFILTARYLIGFFTADPQTIHWGVVSLHILSAVLPFTAAGMAFSGALRGAGDTLSPLWVSLITTSGLGPGLAYLFTITLGYGPTGAWLGLALSVIVQALIIGWIFKRGKWKTIKL